MPGGSGSDSLLGAAGDDSVSGGEGDDTLDGGSGADNLSGGVGSDSLLGGAGADVLDGGAGADILDGGADDDTLIYDASDISVKGGAGTDTLSVSHLSEVDLSTGPAFDSVEVVSLTGSGANSLTLTLDAFKRTGGLSSGVIVEGEDQDTLVLSGTWIKSSQVDADNLVQYNITDATVTPSVTYTVKVNPDIQVVRRVTGSGVVSVTLRTPGLSRSICSRRARPLASSLAWLLDSSWICTGLPTGGPPSKTSAETMIPAMSAVFWRISSNTARVERPRVFGSSSSTRIEPTSSLSEMREPPEAPLNE